jgi:hypothetical protein
VERSSILWRRLDAAGHEAARLRRLEDGWELDGSAVFAHDGAPCRLDYRIHCDPSWHTRNAHVAGWIGDRDVAVTLEATGAGAWRLNGQRVAAVEGALDVDLNFSPSTNLLPIRRLGLAVGAAAPVRAAWLRFPSFHLEPLEQRYQRTAETLYRYESGGGRFTADLEVDAAGFPVRYSDWFERVA